MARPRRCGPTRSIFMLTVVDQVRPWLMPRRTLARITQPQVGAQMSRIGTGKPISQPAISTGLRPARSERVPATKFITALLRPKATMKVNAVVSAVNPNTFVARSGRTVRSWPIIPPTSALMPTRSVNCARFARSPRRTAGLGRAAEFTCWRRAGCASPRPRSRPR